MKIMQLALFMFVVVAVAQDIPSDKEEKEEEIYEVPKLDVIGSFSTMLKVLSYIMHTMANLGSGLGNLLHSFTYTVHPDDYPHHVLHDNDSSVNTTHFLVGSEQTSVNTTHFLVGTEQNTTLETPSTMSTVKPQEPDPTEELLTTTPEQD